jgi:hypothetical protein
VWQRGTASSQAANNLNQPIRTGQLAPKFYGTSTIRVRIKENPAKKRLPEKKLRSCMKCPRLKLILEPKEQKLQEDEEPLIIKETS